MKNLAYPLEVCEVADSSAKVRCEGGQKTVSLCAVEGVKEGDYLLVHGELAVQKLSPEHAKETIKILDSI